MKRALIVDGNSILNRAFFAIKGMTNSEGFPTNALFGFMNILDMVTNELGPDYYAVCFDVKGGTFRNELYSEYKATRKGMDPDLFLQLGVIKEILTALGLKVVEMTGFEADDLIGTLSYRFSENGVEAYILTGDKDSLQLVGDKRFVYYHGTKNKRIYDEKAVLDDMGVLPHRVTDLKGIMGDSSDNIPGIRGIGPKGALKLLSQFDTVEDLVERSEEIDVKRIRDLVEEHAEMAVLSKKLATIVTAIPIEFDTEDFVQTSFDDRKLADLLEKYQLKVLKNRLGSKLDDGLQDLSPVVIKRESISEELKDYDFNLQIYISVIAETFDVIHRNFPYIAVYQEGKNAIFADMKSQSELIDFLKRASLSQTIKIGAKRLKEAMLMLLANGISNFEPVFDLSVMAYLIDPNRSYHSIKDLAESDLSSKIPAIDEIFDESKKSLSLVNADSTELENCLSYEFAALVKLQKILAEKIEKLGMKTLYEEIDLPLSEVLAHMQHEGFRVDGEELKRINALLEENLAELEKLIHFMAGEEFNINSPQQLGVVLFEKLNLKGGKKTKTGYSTSKDILDKLKSSHPIIEKILEYRTYAKLKSTYTEGLASYINLNTGKIHSYLEQTVAATGRISSHDPNLQNIPMRYELGRELRKAFIPSDENHVILSADYSQIELRLLAHLSGDKAMIEAYREGIDIHLNSAAKILKKPAELITPAERSSAKAVNFGLIYGMGEFSLAGDLGISLKEAKKYIENYFAAYPTVEAFLETTKKQAEKNGFVTTMFGRVRPIPELKSKNFNLKSYGLRIAMNTPIQGSAADIIKKAMISLFNRLKESGLKSKLIMQVHDELIIDCLEGELGQVEKMLVEEMENAVSLSVKLEANLSKGENWYEAK